MNPAATRLAHGIALVLVVGLPGPLVAQGCTLRLSEVDAATTEFARDVAALSGTLERMFDEFARLEARARNAEGECPAEIASSRAAAEALGAQALAARGDVLLECGQAYGLRVQRDIAAATADKDSQMVLRLGEIQRRILDVQQRSTESVVEATFLGLRTDRLLLEHDILSRRCEILRDAYD